MIKLKELAIELEKEYSDCEYSLFWCIIGNIIHNSITTLDEINDIYDDYLCDIDMQGPINQEYANEAVSFCRSVIADKLHQNDDKEETSTEMFDKCPF